MAVSPAWLLLSDKEREYVTEIEASIDAQLEEKRSAEGDGFRILRGVSFIVKTPKTVTPRMMAALFQMYRMAGWKRIRASSDARTIFLETD